MGKYQNQKQRLSNMEALIFDWIQVLCARPRWLNIGSRMSFIGDGNPHRRITRSDSMDSFNSTFSAVTTNTGISSLSMQSVDRQEIWIPEEQRAMIWKMKDPIRGILLRDHWKSFKTYKRCFAGREVVQWIVSNHFASKLENAETIAKEIFEKKVFQPYHHKKMPTFRRDMSTYYKFSNAEDIIMVAHNYNRSIIAHYKFCVIGVAGTGKTSCCKNWASGQYQEVTTKGKPPNQYYTRYGERIAEEVADIELLDCDLPPLPTTDTETKNEEFKRGLVDLQTWSDWASGMLLTYSTSSRGSFEEISRIFQAMRYVTRFHASVLVVAVDFGEENMKVTPKEGEELAKKHRCPHIVISVGKGFQLAVEQLAKAIQVGRPKMIKSGWVKMRSGNTRSFKKQYLTLLPSSLQFHSKKPMSSADNANLKGIISITGNCMVSMEAPPQLKQSASELTIQVGGDMSISSPDLTSNDSPSSVPTRKNSFLQQPHLKSNTAPSTPENTRQSRIRTGSFLGSSRSGSFLGNLSNDGNSVCSDVSGRVSLDSSSSQVDGLGRLWLVGKTGAEYELIFKTVDDRDEWYTEITYWILSARNTEQQRQVTVVVEDEQYNNSSGTSSEISPKSHSVSEMTNEEIIQMALQRFEQRPKKSIDYLIQNEVLQDAPDAVCSFLCENVDKISKRALGEYFGECRDGFVKSVLILYLKSMDFESMTYDGAIRKFMSTFLLPGESQKISPILEMFARRYCECNPDAFKNVAHTLAFSIMMLQTDAHNSAVVHKMTREQFCSNTNVGLQALSPSLSLPMEYLSAIYNRVVDSPILFS
ncbi:brefeldin A-inhibited guanine nucleotide-exchange protein 1-like [Planoprotostelium fungivorum]|uniref:Brefeldin A-inhibited guanine nucleotide-exchange protein 1-like n=1 Tax=Planoprotostelium fungivorum TaxID=1890364 RepID=A0A2P6MRH2_9EUKA|nr:brefeldin A-inhibited guanine nucleotide-exchange protein 1-like [Planoprotostelium fungivorum]